MHEAGGRTEGQRAPLEARAKRSPAQLYRGHDEEARREAEIVEHILGITDVALAHIELGELIRELLGRIRDVLRADEASILVLDPDESSLSLRVLLSPDELVSNPVHVRIGEGFAGRIAATKQPIIVDDTSTFPFVNNSIVDRGIRSVVGAPMLVNDRVLGVVRVGSLSVRHFDDHELRLLKLAAARIALAIDRSNQFEAERVARDLAEKAQRRNEFLARASEILSSSLDQRAILSRVTRFVVPELANRCTVNLVGEDGIVRLVAVGGLMTEKESATLTVGEAILQPLEECESIQAIVETGIPLVLREVPDNFLQEISMSPAHLEALRRLRLVSCMRVPMKAGGRVIGVMTFWLSDTDRRYQSDDLSLAEDLTHRVALSSDNAWHYQEARKAIGARDEFISIASHELRTPLTTVKGYVQLLDRHLNGASGDPLRARRTLEQLRDQVDRFEELVGELLDITRIQSDSSRLNRAECDLSGVVRQVVERFQLTLESGGPRRINVHAPDVIVGSWDASRLDQVVTNLLSNALKYSPFEKDVDVVVRLCEECVEVSVTDHGIGINEDEREVIFQPFRRGGGATDVASGAGLGLYISNEIVRRHGGYMTLESAPGQGSTFTFCLPLNGIGPAPAA